MPGDHDLDLSSQDKPRHSSRANGFSLSRLILIVAGLGAVVAFVGNVRKGIISVDWPTTSGKILTSTIEDDGESYEARVIYSYQVGGVHYQGYDVHVSEGQWGDGRDHALATVHNYPAGAAAVVHFNPASPGTAVLEPGPNRGDSGILLVGLILLAVAVFGSSLGIEFAGESRAQQVPPSLRTRRP